MPKSAETAVSRSYPRDSPGVATTPTTGQLGQQVLASLVATLFFARFFLPAESAAQGDTLWIAALWMVCGLAWLVGIWRGVFPRIRLDWLDAALGIWIGGQVVSAISVIVTSGEKRSAANLACEWMALGLMWCLVRHGVVGWQYRGALLRASVVAGTLLGGYGLFQHYVSHPRLVAEYGPLFDKLRSATGSDATAIQQKLARDGIPTDGPAAILFEKRLRDSREPLGLFALANTFGGFLAVCLLLAIGEILAVVTSVSERSGVSPPVRHLGFRRWTRLAPLILSAAVLSACLLLTKSRTAWLGSVCGALVLFGLRFRLAPNLRRLLIPAGLAGGALVAAAGLLFAMGGLDRQVLSEAPKSLAYRIQYWRATSRLIADHAWLGVGPGNFRQHYLKYKLPEASEEIADPHNLVFDTAATGGMISLAGLLMFLGLALVRGWQSVKMESAPPAAEATPPSAPRREVDGISEAVYWMPGAGALLAFAGSFFCWGEWGDSGDRLLCLAVLSMGLAGLFRWCWPTSVMDAAERHRAWSSAALAAACALTVHLLGAGGIAMPGVSQFLLVLLACSLGPARRSITATAQIPAVAATSPSKSWILDPGVWTSCLMGMVTVVGLIGIIATSLWPVIECRNLLAQGSASAWSAGPQHRDEAQSLYRRAATVDPWSPDPWRYQFEWLQGAGIQSNDLFETAVKDLHEVMRRDPVNFWGPRTLGRIWFQKSALTHKREDVGQAIRWLQRATDLYPTNCEIQAELALALAASGETSSAATAAREALAQDRIYHQQGHIDRYLAADVRERLQSLIGQSPR